MQYGASKVSSPKLIVNTSPYSAPIESISLFVMERTRFPYFWMSFTELSRALTSSTTGSVVTFVAQETVKQRAKTINEIINKYLFMLFS